MTKPFKVLRPTSWLPRQHLLEPQPWGWGAEQVPRQPELVPMAGVGKWLRVHVAGPPFWGSLDPPLHSHRGLPRMGSWDSTGRLGQHWRPGSRQIRPKCERERASETFPVLKDPGISHLVPWVQGRSNCKEYKRSIEKAYRTQGWPKRGVGVSITLLWCLVTQIWQHSRGRIKGPTE